jgi:hypothetical protein
MLRYFRVPPGGSPAALQLFASGAILPDCARPVFPFSPECLLFWTPSFS